MRLFWEKIKNLKIYRYFFVLLGALGFAVMMYIGRNIQISSFESCLYSFFKMGGSSPSPIIFATLYILIFLVLFGILLLLPVLPYKKTFKIRIKGRDYQIFPIVKIEKYGIILTVISVLFLAYQMKIFPFIYNTFFLSTDIFDKYYVETAKTSITFPKEKRNLIYIFMESMEMSNAGKENGGIFEETIIPNLENLALENINFSNNEKLGGAEYAYATNWTAAAMISQTSGVPLRVKISDFNVNSTRFGNIKTLGDVLADNGYNNYLLVGSNSNFGGRRAYFINHNYLIYDYYTAIKDGKISDDYYEWWGYEDAKLFLYAKEYLEKISKNGKPFNFTILTADTHFTDGYVDRSCEEVFDDHYKNSFYCSDKMIGEFISWVKEQDFYENTTIVLVGDHHTMQDNFYNEDNYERGVYNAFINAKVKGSFNNKNRIFTTLDMFPTTLASLGAEIDGNRLGLGTNLFSDLETVPELMGIDNFNRELMKGSTYYFDVIRK